MFTVQMDSGFSGKHMGLTFVDGKAQTNNVFLATRLKSRGYKVTAEKGADDTKVPEQVEESKGKSPKDKKPENKRRDNNNSRNKPANNAEPAPASEPAALESEPEANEPPNLPPLDDEQGDE